MAHSIDINCDLGESYGQFSIGNDNAVFPLITSCNIACGFHAGDPVQMERTLSQAINNHVQIGAHPSYPDRWGFGRRVMQLSTDEIRAFIRYQVAALCGMAEAMGGEVEYVKPHGALYNKAMGDREVATAIVEAVKSLGKSLALMGMPGSEMAGLAAETGLAFVAEGFADRRYREGRLISRSDPQAIILDPQEAADQAVSIVVDRQVLDPKGEPMPLEVKSICVHGDHPSAVVVLEAIHMRFQELGITKRAFIA